MSIVRLSRRCPDVSPKRPHAEEDVAVHVVELDCRADDVEAGAAGRSP
jgi:hypothetical protein